MVFLKAVLAIVKNLINFLSNWLVEDMQLFRIPLEKKLIEKQDDNYPLTHRCLFCIMV